MKKILTAGVVFAGLFVSAPVALASAPTSAHLRQYRHDYRAARREFGPAAVGCNLIGKRGSCHVRVSDEVLVTSLGVLGRMLNPPAPVRAAPTATSTPTPTTGTTTSVTGTRGGASVNTSASVSSGGGCGGDTPYSGGGQCWAIPYSIVQCESRGRNVPNSQGSGANGYYQLMSGGGGSKSQQDAAAAALWNGGAGAGNWVCKG